VPSIRRLSSKSTNQKLRMQSNVRQRQNASHRAWLLQQRREETKKESPRYTGDYVIGIATLHKSNAVPVTNKEYATEISAMIK